MSPAITDNLLAAVYVTLSIVGAGENHAKPKADFAVHLGYTVNSKKGYIILIPVNNYPHYPYYSTLAKVYPLNASKRDFCRVQHITPHLTHTHHATPYTARYN
jgi:hypothetical protein